MRPAAFSVLLLILCLGLRPATAPAADWPALRAAETERQYQDLVKQIADRAWFDQVAAQTFRQEALILPGDRDPLDVVLRRTASLAREMEPRAASAAATARKALDDLQARAQATPLGETAARRALFDAACAVRRTLAFSDPLLKGEAILFARSAPGMLPHMSDEFYGWWSRPGGGICLLTDFRSDSPQVRNLTADLPPGNFIRPSLSWDGRKILFAYARHYPQLAGERNKRIKTTVPEDAFYHLYEMNADGSGRRQLTRGRYDDFDAHYLPGGQIAFLSTRKGVFVQSTEENTARTLTADLPDSFVRCGGDDFRPVSVFTLHGLSADGTKIWPLSAFENFEYTPSVAADGRILYTRWDYIDRFNGHFFSLWSANPDGTNSQLVYGNYTVRPQVKCEARSIPGSNALVFTGAAHHSHIGGSLVVLNRAIGTEESAPIARLTPEVPFPETERNADSFYANPWPLSENHYLTAWSDRPLPPHHIPAADAVNPANTMGLYLLDAFGNRELLFRDPEISCVSPMPLQARERPPVVPEAGRWDGTPGRLLLQNVYAGLPGIAPGSIKSLRIVATPPKVQPFMNNPVIGVSNEDNGKYVLGTVPVEPDGSAHFEIPSGVPVFFQALTSQGLALQTMRSFTYVTGGQTLACVGCHEPRNAAPARASAPALAARRAPSRPVPDAEGSWPWRYEQLVQPVLDKHCVECHRPGGDEKAARLPLTADASYRSLTEFGDRDLRNLAFEKDRSVPGEMPAAKSKLLALIRSGHGKARLDARSEYRLVLWMDVYATRRGAFSDEQENELTRFKERWLAGAGTE